MAVAKYTFEISKPAGADLSANQYSVVKLSSGTIILCSVAGERALGVLQNDPGAAGRSALVGIGGLFKVKLGGTVSENDLLTCDAAGLAVAATATDWAFGTALVAGVSGDVVEAIVGTQGATV